MTRPADLRGLLAPAVEAAHEAGADLLARWGHAGSVAYKSSATDPVSEADEASERLLVARLLDARPDDGLLGEEGATREGTTGLRWVIDPLDGTVNYLYGLGDWAVSIACEDRHGAAVVAVVFDPVRGETFTATAGGGAACNGQPLRVRDPVELARALVATGFAYDRQRRARQAGVVAALLPRVRDIRRAGSAALDLCAVAAGRVDAYYEDTSSRWDWAAGALVAAEAGAVVTRLGDGVLAAGPALHAPLQAAVCHPGRLYSRPG